MASTDPLADLASESDDLTQALAELRSGNGLRETEGHDVLRDADVPDLVLDRFLSLAVREVSGPVLFGLALSLSMCIAWRDAGAEALDYCLASRNLSDSERDFVFSRMALVKVPGETLATRHDRVRTASIAMNNFAHYETFLQEHIDGVLAECRSEFEALVLDPAFPPTNYRLDCVIWGIERASDPTPYQRKVAQWVASGDLEPYAMTLGVFYSYLSDRFQDPRYAGVRRATYARLIALLRDPEATPAAWAHFLAIIERRFAGAAELLSEIRSSGVVLTDEQRAVLEYPVKAVVALAAGGVGPDGRSFDHWWGLTLDNRPPAPAE